MDVELVPMNVNPILAEPRRLRGISAVSTMASGAFESQAG
jgi:hypothetical protein